VKTWDMYDYVLGAMADKMGKVISIGGDAAGINKEGAQANRFKPVVKYLGPFHSNGGNKSHTFTMPKYIGSVRTMVIAGYDGAYGSSEKTSKVKQPLMVLGTLPRVLSPTEKTRFPVTIFTDNNSMKNVTVSLLASSHFKIVGSATQNVAFEKAGEKIAWFDIEVLNHTGVGKVTINASSGKEKADYDIELDVRNPNPLVHKNTGGLIQGVQSWATAFSAFGTNGTNKATLELSTIPALNLGTRLGYLIQYPHGCIEQTTSSVFPQLHLASLMELDKATQTDIQNKINMGIARLSSFQLMDGAFSYWPGMNESDEWGTNYAGHFLIEAKGKGYAVNPSMLSKWVKYQTTKANNWTTSDHSINQAYRLYTLALAGEAQQGAMNRMKEKTNLSSTDKYLLAGAYAIIGQKDIANSIIANTPKIASTSSYYDYYSYGDNTRDNAIILETMTLLGKREDGYMVLQELSKSLSTEKYMSTQTTAYSLLAIAKYLGKNSTSKGLQCTYTLNGKANKVSSKSPMVTIQISEKDLASGKLNVQNDQAGMLFVRLLQEGKPATGDTISGSENLLMSITYKGKNGAPIDIANLPQGTEFEADVSVTNTSSFDVNDVALSQILPAGWEVINTRLEGTEGSNIQYTYRDIKDDRVYTYFDIPKQNTKHFKVKISATYAGRYWMPTQLCESMYQNNYYAKKAGKWVVVR
jgi:alpha-2-macroglobulin